MSGQQDLGLAAAIIALITTGLALGYAPWALASIVIAAVVVLIAAAVAGVRPGRCARRAAGALLLLSVPAGLQAYVNYPGFLRAWNPHSSIVPLTHQDAWHPAALTHYVPLLAILTLAAAALVCAIAFGCWQLAQRRSVTGERSWPRVGDHSGQYTRARDGF
jgi:hypothetical protein